MSAIITNNLRFSAINNFKDDVVNESVYFCFSNPKDWTNPNIPEEPFDNYTLKTDVFSDALYLKKISEINVTNVIPYYRWIPNVRYQQYSDTEDIKILTSIKSFIPATAVATIQSGIVTSVQMTNFGSGYSSAPNVSLVGGGGTGATAVAIVSGGIVSSIVVTNGGQNYTSSPTVVIDPPTNISNQPYDLRPFYVITDELNVYKCLNNNNSALSTQKPIHTTTNEGDTGTTYSDGYVWKFMYSISKLEAERFLTPNWVPIKTLNFNDNSLQWEVQRDPTAIKHGKDPVKELGATNLMVKVRVNGNEGGQIVDTNEYRQISLVKNPIARGSVYTPQSATNNTIILNSSHDISDINAKYYPSAGKKIMIVDGIGHGQIRKIQSFNPVTREVILTENWNVIPTTTSKYGIILQNEILNQCLILQLGTVNNGPFIEDEQVTQISTGATGTIVKFDSIENKLYITNITGNFNGTSQITSGSVTATVIGKIDPDVDVTNINKYLVNVLYVENRKPIARFQDQIEDIKLVIVF